MTDTALRPDQLYQRCDPQDLDFDTTAELTPLDGFMGQQRAVDALQFGIGMRHKGYNLFVLGPSGMGKHALVRREVERRAAEEKVPADWCYVFNFDDMHRPRALRLPPGQGVELQRDSEQLIRDLGDAIVGVFESDEYRTRVQSMHEALEEQQEQAFSEIQQHAEEKDIALLRTPTGITLAPLQKGKPLGPQEFHKLPEEDRKRIEQDITALQEDLRRVLHQLPLWKKRTDEQVEALNHELASTAIAHLFEVLAEKYAELEPVTAHLQQVQADVIEHYRAFLPDQDNKPALLGLQLQRNEGPPWQRRYQVNLLLAHDRDGGAPVVYEDLPSYNNLVGRVEHRANMGALETDFTLVRAGALHRANGGYLVLDALKLLLQPFAWDGLKRALQAGEIRIESLGQITSLISTLSLEPEPIPLTVKVVLIGDRRIYYLLSMLDPELDTLFKVAVDFEDRFERDAESTHLYARLIASLVQQERLRPFDRAGVARIVEQGARLAEDNQRLSGHMRSLADLAREADYWAGQHGRAQVGAAEVQRAIDAQIGRADRIRRRIQEEIERGTILIDIDGSQVGQVNGLAVIALGGFRFGHPSRITARTRLGDGEVLDIEREAKLGGPIHSKGVLILQGFLSGRYVPQHPLSLSASLVFEQSYGGVEGDSASSAELYALLSSLAQTPIRQDLAVTGSVNQQGQIQAIGGVNEKIEGFFDICAARGLTGTQGVIIPSANVKHLMLRQDVVEAVAQGRFSVHAVSSVDQGIALLTGLPAGQRDADGGFPPDSLNGRVEARLIGYAERLQALAAARNGRLSDQAPNDAPHQAPALGRRGSGGEETPS
ncbi:AAA family ATPase [Thiohalocapsa marina]|uniref:endopeptidase La n=1 Tax=Thiohalocapsa marina TaxID=424902 RepID=A0A5M8FHJ2_9GAMM|nr:ATP-binding protein [Thiohalocapsa marina]KAA6184179.1 AAA family ATPase [Thiohalocapsa marina]